MSQKYYGLEDQEIFYHTDIEEVYTELEADRDSIDDIIGLVIIEMVESKKSGFRYCPSGEEYDPECSAYDCQQYSPRNGKNGICKYLRYALHPTGRRWRIVGENTFERIKESEGV